MIYSYARDNLDIGFNLCFYLSLIFFGLAVTALLTIVYYFIFKLQRIKFYGDAAINQQQNNIQLSN